MPELPTVEWDELDPKILKYRQKKIQRVLTNMLNMLSELEIPSRNSFPSIALQAELLDAVVLGCKYELLVSNYYILPPQDKERFDTYCSELTRLLSSPSSRAEIAQYYASSLLHNMKRLGSGRYNPIRFAIRFAKDYPALAAGAAGLLFAETAVGSEPTIYHRLARDMAFAGILTASGYVIPLKSFQGRRLTKVIASLLVGGTALGLYTLSFYNGQQEIPRDAGREPSSASAPAPISGTQRGPRKGDTYTVKKVRYDISGAPFLLLELDGNGDLCVPYPGLTYDNYLQVQSGLEGRTIELGRDPVSRYDEGDINCHVLPKSMIRVK